MRDDECVRFLQWALPKLGLHWPGYRKVRGTVRKRLGRRLRELGIGDLSAYRAYLNDHPEEWERLGAFCHIPISRFFRDRAVWKYLETDALPALATRTRTRGDSRLFVLSLGCASGEEAYSLTLLWGLRLVARFPDIRLDLWAVDVDETMLRRAKSGCYSRGSLKELPLEWIDQAFNPVEGEYCIQDAFRGGVRFERRDIRRDFPEGRFDLILCRNLAFTYFEQDAQMAVLERIVAALRLGGLLVIGSHEQLPEGGAGYVAVAGALPIYSKVGTTVPN